MKKFLLIKDDTVLEFKTFKGREKYNLKAMSDGLVYLSVDVGINFYTIHNPYLVKGFQTEQVYSFNEVLEYCASF